MKKIFWLTLLAAFGLTGAAQTTNNTLLWRITGNNTTKPSYLFGTIHMICATDIQLSDSLRTAIRNADKVYLELDMDNMFEMLGALGKMKMRNDTTLADLLTKEEYQKVKDYFNKKGGMIPFSMLETYKPMLAASTFMQQSMDCDNMIVMDQLVMEEAARGGTEIKGLESVAYQMGIFDSIPYKFQAKQLLKYVEEEGKGQENGNKEFEALTKAYRNQELKKLEELIGKDQSMGGFNDLLLYNRNSAWVKKLQTLLSSGSLVIAVGAGHLPGDKGVIHLLRKAGYKVEPVKNEMIKNKMKEM